MRVGAPGARGPLPAAEGRAGALARAREFAAQLPLKPRAVAVSLGVAIGLFAALGSIYYYAGYPSILATFDVNAENKHGIRLPSIFSAGLLFAAGWVAFREWRSEATPGWPWLGIAGFLAFMGLDELATIHEHLAIWTGTNWQLLYLPVVAFGAVFWLALLGALAPSPLSRLLWIGGAAAWFVSQTIEHFELKDLVFDSHGHPVGTALPVFILGEEIMEMIGSALFLLAILVFASRASNER